MMRAAFDRRRLTMTSMLNDIEGVVCGARGRLLLLPLGQGLLVGASGTTSGEQRGVGRICINEAKVAAVPGEAFGAPGYFRMSYALGDDDLVEGVSRLATLFGEGKTDRQVGGELAGSEEATAVARVLVTEKIAQSGLDLLHRPAMRSTCRKG